MELLALSTLVIALLNIAITLEIRKYLNPRNGKTNTVNKKVANALKRIGEKGAENKKARVAVHLSKPYKWDIVDIQTNTKLIIFIRNTEEDIQKMVVHYGKSTDTYTVTTTLKHPQKGRGNLHRKGITRNELKGLFNNPRKHTNKGKYEE